MESGSPSVSPLVPMHRLQLNHWHDVLKEIDQQRVQNRGGEYVVANVIRMIDLKVLFQVSKSSCAQYGFRSE